MPITSDQILNYLSIAQQALEKEEQIRQTFDHIQQDLTKLRHRLNEKQFKDEDTDDLLHNLLLISRDAVQPLPIETVQFIAAEMTKFKLNQQKNKHRQKPRQQTENIE